jgi:hypothetical protein
MNLGAVGQMEVPVRADLQGLALFPDKKMPPQALP